MQLVAPPVMYDACCCFCHSANLLNLSSFLPSSLLNTQGFGHDLAVDLGKKGWKVYAGCLTDQGIQNLKEKVSSISALKLDVTKEADIDAAVKRIRSESPQGLYCLVNNAGIGKVSSIGLVWVDLLTSLGENT